jgi:hypothetical protein
MMSRCVFGCEESDGLGSGTLDQQLFQHDKSPTEASFSMILILHIPHRLQRVCDLLWRLPKLDVPFAIQIVNLDVTGSRFRLTYS